MLQPSHCKALLVQWLRRGRRNRYMAPLTKWEKIKSGPERRKTQSSLGPMAPMSWAYGQERKL